MTSLLNACLNGNHIIVATWIAEVFCEQFLIRNAV